MLVQHRVNTSFFLVQLLLGDQIKRHLYDYQISANTSTEISIMAVLHTETISVPNACRYPISSYNLFSFFTVAAPFQELVIKMNQNIAFASIFPRRISKVLTMLSESELCVMHNKVTIDSLQPSANYRCKAGVPEFRK